MEQKQALPHQLQQETILANRYQIDGVLGEGGFGITYIGRDLNLEFEVAIKEYYPSGLANRNHTHSKEVQSNTGKAEAAFEKGRDSFLKEARALARFVREPGIVNVRDFFMENNTAYIVMDYLDGITLKEWLVQNKILPVDQTLDLMKPIMEALSRIHQEGLIHRDVSPDNIMVLKEGSIKLLDFGAARDVSGLDEKSLSVMLKPGYAPEEQYRSKGKQGSWTDVYALSATIYKCITGITPEESIERVFNEEVKKPSELGVEIDEHREAALMKGMAVLQKDRFQTIQQLQNGLFGKSISRGSRGVGGIIGGSLAQGGLGESASKSNIDKNATMYADAPIVDPVRRSNITVQSDDFPEGLKEVQASNTASTDFSTSSDEGLPSALEKEKEKESGRGKKENLEEPQKSSKGEKSRKESKKSRKRKIIIGMIAAVLGLGAVLALIFLIQTPTAQPTQEETEEERRVYVGGVGYRYNRTRLRLSNRDYGIEDLRGLLEMPYLEELEMVNINLDNEIIQMLAGIPSLIELDISDNPRVTALDGLEGLPNLTTLNLSDTGISNPSLLGEFPSLEYVALDNVGITEIEFINDISQLVGISLSNNNISNINELKGVGTFTHLDLSNNNIEDISALANIPSLTYVDLSGNQIHDVSALASNYNLIHIDLSGNQIHDVSALASIYNLAHVDISRNYIRDISSLSDLEYLEEIKLNYNQISEIPPLSSEESLVTFEARGNQIADLTPLAGHTELINLYLSDNQITTLDPLINHTRLVNISFSDNQLDNINGISNATLLRIVGLSNNNLTDVSSLGKSADVLAYVYLNNNQISDISFLEGAHHLLVLEMANNQVADISPLEMSSSLQRISMPNNRITSILPLRSTEYMGYADFSNNQLESMSGPMGFTGFHPVLNFSNNQIRQIELPPFSRASGVWVIRMLLLDGNHIDDFSQLAYLDYQVHSDGMLALSYYVGFGMDSIDEGVQMRSTVYIIDAPLDRHERLRLELAERFLSVYFVTADEMQEVFYEKASQLSWVEEMRENAVIERYSLLITANITLNR